MRKNHHQAITPHQKERKIFLNNMNSWFSNFIIEAMRTESIQDPRVIKNSFMGTLNNTKNKLPYLFEPKETKIDINYHYEHEVFSNDIFIYDLQDSDFNEIEYIIKGLKTLKHQTEKVIIIVSTIMTWARTPPKLKKEKSKETNVENEALDQEDSDDKDTLDDDKYFEEENAENFEEENKINLENKVNFFLIIIKKILEKNHFIRR